VIERLDRSLLKTELVPFNLGKAVLQKDPVHNLVLQPGDVVTILSQNDISLPQERKTRLVRIEGEVGAPGVYHAKAGETLAQLLLRAGGLTPQAYVFGTEFTRESVRARQQENLAQLSRRLEAQLQSQGSTAISNLRSDNAAAAQAIQQQQQTQIRAQLERLKTLRSNGRVSLELNPLVQTVAELPDLPLEDSDRILIPPRPSFVAAVGSVNNENVFIHKPGKTVADVIKTAGLMEDAELSQAFVLRADGSIISRRDSRSLFGSSGFESLGLMPGDTVVVPAQLDRESNYNFVTRSFKDWTQIFANLGLGVAAIRSINSR
jgi:protein involved in polysaccharide export with SLBB domain